MYTIFKYYHTVDAYNIIDDGWNESDSQELWYDGLDYWEAVETYSDITDAVKYWEREYNKTLFEVYCDDEDDIYTTVTVIIFALAEMNEDGSYKTDIALSGGALSHDDLLNAMVENTLTGCPVLK